MSRSPELTGIPAAPMVTHVESKVMEDPSAAMDPPGQPLPLICLESMARVLSAYIMVTMSVLGPEVPSGLVTVGPKFSPGSMAGRMTLQPGFAELGPLKVKFSIVGGRLTLAPMLQPAAFVVLGMEMPPVGIPVPVWMRS